MSDEDELRRLSDEWMQAAMRRDDERMRQIMASEFTIRGTLKPDSHIDVATWRRNLEMWDVSRFEVDVTDVQVIGPLALTRSTHRWKAKPGSKLPSGTSTCVDAWVRQDGSWKVLRREVVERRDEK